MPDPWTPELDERLRHLCADRLPFSEIAARLGRSRNACIGRANRKGFSNRSVSASATTQRSTKRRAVKFSTANGIDGYPYADRLRNLAPNQCRFALNTEPTGDHTFCGNPVAAIGGSWCAAHLGTVYEPVKPAAKKKRTGKRTR